MSLQTIKNQKGFTIVELLIVIVVIGILAAITIVAFNGVQNRGKASSAQSAANAIVKKAEAYNSIVGSYPTTVANFDAQKESTVTGQGIGLGTPSSSNGTNTVSYEYCSAGTPTGGARIGWNDFANSNTTKYVYAGRTATDSCSTWAATPTLAP